MLQMLLSVGTSNVIDIVCNYQDKFNVSANVSISVATCNIRDHLSNSLVKVMLQIT